MKTVLLVFSVLMARIYTAKAIVCPPGFCDTVNCDNSVEKSDCEQNKNGIYEQNGSFCGCCPACLTKLYEGDQCVSLIRREPPTAACSPELKCDLGTKKCAKH